MDTNCALCFAPLPLAKSGAPRRDRRYCCAAHQRAGVQQARAAARGRLRDLAIALREEGHPAAGELAHLLHVIGLLPAQDVC